MRPHRHAMPTMPKQLPVRLPAVPPVPVPAAAPLAAMARLAVASAVAADAGLVLTRTIAPRRVRFAAGHTVRGARKRAKHCERSPFLPESGLEGAEGGREGPQGRVLPINPPRAGGRKESPYRAEFPRTSAFSRDHSKLACRQCVSLLLQLWMKRTFRGVNLGYALNFMNFLEFHIRIIDSHNCPFVNWSSASRKKHDNEPDYNREENSAHNVSVVFCP